MERSKGNGKNRGNGEGGNLSLTPFPPSLSISSLYLDFISLSISSFALHFLILSPFPRSLAARLLQVVTACTTQYTMYI